MRKLLLVVLACQAILGWGTAHAKNCSPKINNSGETCSYRYVLVLNKNDKVCKHMKEVFDYKFARPFDLRGFSDKQQSDTLFPIYSRYPSSDEFEAVDWRTRMVTRKTDDGATYQWPVLFAEFDIDNDGGTEIVIKDDWFTGERDSRESLLFFKKGEIDPNKLSEWNEIYGQPGKSPRGIGTAARIIRPFVIDSMSYLMMYESSGRNNSGFGAFWGKQTMWVRKYKGGGQNNDKSPLVVEDICKFNMIRFD